jgi:hypothetical protein
LTEPLNNAGAVQQPRRSFRQVLKSYFYWTYPRGCIHYDVMVTLILLFIFLTPHIWNYGDKPSFPAGPPHPIQVVANDGHGLILTVQASDVDAPVGATNNAVRSALRKAVEPVTGDSVFVDSWETVTDGQGNIVWKIWAHR